jgi:pyrroloquinoline quinone biosynthesis protein D
MTSPSTITLESVPTLAAGVRLHTDPVSAQPVLLYPEGVVVLSETAQAIVARCDGKTSVSGITAALAAEYDAPANALEADIIECLADLAGRTLVAFRS